MRATHMVDTSCKTSPAGARLVLKFELYPMSVKLGLHSFVINLQKHGHIAIKILNVGVHAAQEKQPWSKRVPRRSRTSNASGCQNVCFRFVSQITADPSLPS